MDKKEIRKLAGRLGFKLLARFYFCGGLLLLGPVIFFSWSAADDILWQVIALGAVWATAALWFYCFDFVRLAKKRGYEPFCSVWLKILPEDKPEGTLFFLAMKSGVPAFSVGIALLFLWRDSLMAGILLGTLAWFCTFPFVLARYLQRRLAERNEVSGGTAPPLVVQKDPRSQLRALWHYLKDLFFWTWIMPPVWMALVLALPGLLMPPPAPEVAAFFDKPREPLRDDGFYALAGIEAPLGEADFIAYGKRKAARLLAAGRMDLKATPAPLLNMPDHFNICKGPKPKPKPVDLPPPSPPRNTVPPPPGKTVEAPLPLATPYEPPCLYLEEWEPIIAANAELLGRFEKLYTFEDFRVPPELEPLDAYPSRPLMDLSRLKAIAYALRAYKGDPEGALRSMLENARFAARLVNTPAPFHIFGAALTCHSLSMTNIVYVLEKQPGLAKQYRKDIEDALLFLDYDSFDYMKIWEAEARYFPSLMETQNSYVKDDGWLRQQVTKVIFSQTLVKEELYAMTKEVEKALALKNVADRNAAINRILKTYGRPTQNIRFTKIGEVFYMAQKLTLGMLMDGFAMGLELFYTNGRSSNKNRTCLAQVDAVAEGAFPDRMEEFLKAAAARDPHLSDVRNGAPFDWQEKDRGVCFDQRYNPDIPSPVCFFAPKYVEREDQLQ